MQEKPWWAQNEEANDTDQVKVKDVRPSNGKGMILGSIALISMLTAGLVTATFVKPNPYAPHPGQFQSIEYPATVNAVIAECGSIFNFESSPKHYGQFPQGFFDGPDGASTKERLVPEQPMIIPAYGYMSNKSPVNVPSFIGPDAKERPSKQQVLRMMWEGKLIIWYMPPTSAGGPTGSNDKETMEAIQRYAESHENTVALPWEGERGLPLNREVAFGMWNTTQSCELWSSDVVDEFVASETKLRKERPVEPPYAPLQDNGELYPISVMAE